MNDQPTQPADPSDSPRVAVGIAYGYVAAAAFAVAYAASAELIGLSFGLPVVALIGGWIIGTAVAYGGWGEVEHLPHRGLRMWAVSLSIEGWLLGLVFAYAFSQIFLPQSVIPLTERLSVGGFFDYFLGLDIVRFIHLLSLALVAVMAWRAAR